MAEIKVTATDDSNRTHDVSETTADDSSPLSGEGSTGGGGSASTSKTEPNADGDTTTTNQVWRPEPDGPAIKRVEIKVKRSCPRSNPGEIELSGSGNVSVSGRVEGTCIFVTEVNAETDKVTGVMKTVTKKKKKCCNPPSTETGMAPAQEGGAEFAVSSTPLDPGRRITLDRQTLVDLDLLRRFLK